MRHRIRAWLPAPHDVQSRRGLRWLGPLLKRSWLWHLDRRRVAAGAAIGVFFGFLIPIGQIPLSAAGAVVLRANLPVAAVTTLVSNPFTYAPIYVLAYKTGSVMLGERPSTREVAAIERAAEKQDPLTWKQRLAGIGKPLVVGLVTFAVAGAALAWLTVHWAWVLAVRLRRARRLRKRERQRA